MRRKKTNQEIIDEADYLGPAGTARDMTGLIPANPPDEEGRESYQAIYPYLAKPEEMVAREPEELS